MKIIKEFFKYVIYPVSVENVAYSVGTTKYIGYSKLRVFGFVVARIQRTTPW